MLPPGVQLTVRARRQTLSRRARGRILDLGGAESHRSLFTVPGTDVARIDGADDDRLLRLVDAHERFDTVFSVFQLAGARDLPGTLSRLSRLVSVEGTLLFLEPGRLTGGAGRAQRVVAPAVARTSGLRVDRDIPAALRAAGLSVTDVERHRPGTVQWWLRALVEGAAHHALPLRERG